MTAVFALQGEPQEPVDEVPVAGDLILAAMESRIDDLKDGIVEAAKSEAFGKILPLVEEILKRRDIATRQKQVLEDWETLDSNDVERPKTTRRGGTGIQRGIRTPKADFRLPVLEALIDLGGKAQASTVTDLVGKKMAGVLNDVDYEPLLISPCIRWRNTTAWAHHDMKAEGYVVKNGTRGTWEITDAGRLYSKGVAAA